MRSIIVSICTIVLFASFDGDKDKKCNKWEGHQLYQGEKGGCYYIKIKNKKRTKVYVDKEKCNC